MNIAVILATVKSVADATTEFLRFIQTDQGKQYIAQVQQNHQQIEDFFTRIGTPFKGLVDKIKADIAAQ
jgi:hypothetical protein